MTNKYTTEISDADFKIIMNATMADIRNEMKIEYGDLGTKMNYVVVIYFIITFACYLHINFPI